LSESSYLLLQIHQLCLRFNNKVAGDNNNNSNNNNNMKSCTVSLSLALVLVALCSGVSAYPWHASCRVTWTFGVACSEAKAALKNQMELWVGRDNCPNGGQKCLYQFLTETDNTLTGTHTTPIKLYIDDISYTFTGAGSSCTVKGYSTSQLWYALLDMGTNYCNIYNLVEGAKLHETANYSESTSDSVCTQYTSRNCEVY